MRFFKEFLFVSKTKITSGKLKGLLSAFCLCVEVSSSYKELISKQIDELCLSAIKLNENRQAKL